MISAILNIGQGVEQDWLLNVLDNSRAQHSVLLQPGEMLWYESARVVHGMVNECKISRSCCHLGQFVFDILMKNFLLLNKSITVINTIKCFIA